jgi:hypothetical protein
LEEGNTVVVVMEEEEEEDEDAEEEPTEDDEEEEEEEEEDVGEELDFGVGEEDGGVAIDNRTSIATASDVVTAVAADNTASPS